MSLEDVSASNIRADIRQIILSARTQLKSMSRQKENLQTFEQDWLRLVELKRSLSA